MTAPNAPEQKPEFIQEIESEADQDMHPVLKYIIENIIIIGIGVGLIVLSVASYSGFKYYQTNKAQKLQTKLESIIAQGNATAQVAQLEQFIASGAGNLKTQAMLSLAGQQMNLKDYEKAAQTWSELITSKNREVTIIASIGQAKSLILAGKPAQAIPVLEKIRETAGDTYKMSIMSDIALAAESAQNWEKALEVYQEIKDSEMGVDPSFVEYKLSELRSKIKNADQKVG